MHHPGSPFAPMPKETPVHSKQTRYVLKRLEGEDKLFEGSEITTLNEFGGAKTIQEESVYEAGCGHIVGLQAHGELTSRCAFCGKWLCYRCGNLRCRRCLKIICESCAKLTDETTVYCKPCKMKVLAKRAIGKLGECIHGFLSKEI